MESINSELYEKIYINATKTERERTKYTEVATNGTESGSEQRRAISD